MDHRDAHALLDQAAVLRHPCDLDLLMFFVRYSQVLLTSETLAGFVGYDGKNLARALEVLLGAGLLEHQSNAHAARFYRFTGVASAPPWLPDLLTHGGMTSGRRSLIAALKQRQRGADRPATDRERAADTVDRTGFRRMDARASR